MSELLPPRDPKLLLTEMTARIKIKDIKRLYELRDRISVKWYESGLVGLLFVAALTFLAVVVKLIPEPNPLIRNFVVGSCVALILIITAILEFLLRKFSALRTLYEQQSRLIEELDKELAKLRQQLEGVSGRATSQEKTDEKTKSGAD